MTEKDLAWQSLMEFCVQNPYCVFDKLEIKGGAPVFGIIPKKITATTTALVSIKFDTNNPIRVSKTDGLA